MSTTKFSGLIFSLLAVICLVSVLVNLGMSDLGFFQTLAFLVLPAVLSIVFVIIGFILLFTNDQPELTPYERFLSDPEISSELASRSVTVVTDSTYVAFSTACQALPLEFYRKHYYQFSFSRFVDNIEQIDLKPSFFTNNDADWRLLISEDNKCLVSIPVTGKYRMFVCSGQINRGIVYHFDLGDYQFICDAELDQYILFEKRPQ